jgi:hypothetical protein
MRKSFFRPFIADPVCASSGPGHHVDVGLALRGTHGVAEWAPEWQVLLVPGASLADERSVFTLAYPAERTECAVDRQLRY